MNQFIKRIIRAAKLDIELYEEVEADKSSMSQAFAVVVLSSIATGVSSIGQIGVSGIISTTISALISWFLMAYIIYFIGAKFFPEPQTHADHGELLRTLGFASAPGLLMIFGLIPGVIGILSLIVQVWMLSALVVAARQALDYTSTIRTLVVCITGMIVYWIALAMLLFLLGARPGL